MRGLNPRVFRVESGGDIPLELAAPLLAELKPEAPHPERGLRRQRRHPDLGSSRIVASEREAPIMLVNMV